MGGVDSHDLGQEPMAGSCKCGNGNALGSIKVREFLRWLNGC
jgi:hypothetical protein